MMRDDGWDPLLDDVFSFLENIAYFVPSVDDNYVAPRRTLCKAINASNLHHYRVDLFNVTINRQLQELDNRFTKINTRLLLCATCLSPSDLFFAFDREKLIRFARFYPIELLVVDVMVLNNQLETYVIDMCFDPKFLNIKEIGHLAEKLVKMKKNIMYLFAFLRVKLTSILSVANVSVEKKFSIMKL